MNARQMRVREVSVHERAQLLTAGIGLHRQVDDGQTLWEGPSAVGKGCQRLVRQLVVIGSIKPAQIYRALLVDKAPQQASRSGSSRAADNAFSSPLCAM